MATIQNVILEILADAYGYQEGVIVDGQMTENPQSRVDFTIERLTNEAKRFKASAIREKAGEDALKDSTLLNKRV